MPTGGTSREHIADAPVTTVVATVMCVGSIPSPLISSEEAYGPGRDTSPPSTPTTDRATGSTSVAMLHASASYWGIFLRSCSSFVGDKAKVEKAIGSYA